jgi:hypothetical protein
VPEDKKIPLLRADATDDDLQDEPEAQDEPEGQAAPGGLSCPVCGLRLCGHNLPYA